MSRTTIPPAILALLKYRWQPTQVGYSFFDSAWSYGPDRQARPSWYHYRKDGGDGLNALKFEEAKALAMVPELTGIALDHGDAAAINEHVEHAISDFCSSVYDAFDVLERRIALIRDAQITEV